MKSRASRSSACALLAGMLLPATPATTPVNADITRGCTASYYLRDNPYQGYEKTFPVPHFTASASCGATIPNRCRIRARDRAHRCMQQHWDDRWQFSRPEECSNRHGVSGYNVQNLKDQIEIAACCITSSPLRNRSGTVRLYRQTWGDNGCGTGPLIGKSHGYLAEISDYDVDCPRIRQRLCPD